MFVIEDYIKNFSKFPAPVALKQWGREHEEISVHTRALTPLRIVDSRRPFEDEGIRTYRKDNYEPITTSLFTRAIDNLQRILSGAQVGITVSNSLEEYINRSDFEGLPFRAFINRRVVRRMIEDPNGVLLWWPKGKGVKVGNEKVDVSPILVLSTQIKHFTPDVFTFLSREKSEVLVQVEGRWKKQYDGKVYYIATTEAFYKYEQFGRISDNKFELKPHYTHELGRLPLVVLGGEEAEDIKKDGASVIYYKSYFQSAVAFANEAVRQFSDHQGILVTSAFPIKEIEQEPCPNKSCSSGFVKHVVHKGENDEVEERRCGVCGGAGYIVPMSPYGVLSRKKSGALLGDKETRDVPMMRYISPDVDIVKYSGDHWDSLLQKAEKALNLLFIDEAQSGKAKEIDREDKVSTLDKIGANVYQNIVLNSLQIIDSLREILPERRQTISISLPATFKTKSEKELIEEIEGLRLAKAPSFLVAQASKDYFRKRYSGDRTMLRAMNFLSIYDPLFYLSQDEKDKLLASATINEEQHGRSLYAFAAITSIAQELGQAFLDAKDEELRKKADEFILPLINSTQLPGDL